MAVAILLWVPIVLIYILIRSAYDLSHDSKGPQWYDFALVASGAAAIFLVIILLALQ